VVRIRSLFPLLALTLVLAAAGTAWSAGPQPADPQPDSKALKDGLAVRYYFAKYNHVRELESWMKYKDGKPGDPIPMLDTDAGSGAVLTSGVTDLVGAHITGYVGFESAGTHRFQVTSNDGVRVTLGGVKIYEDPKVHANRTSDPISVQIDRPGWYPLEVLYFEKKNTAALKLHWSPPGSSGFDPVPAVAFKH